MEMRIFQREDFETYQSWFKNSALNAALGPMDREWLTHVLSERPPCQFSFFDDGELAVVIGVERPQSDSTAWYITDIAVKPAKQRSGLGKHAIELLVRHKGNFEPCPESWIAFVDAKNDQALRFFTKLGWARSREVDKDNFYRFTWEDKRSCTEPSF